MVDSKQKLEDLVRVKQQQPVRGIYLRGLRYCSTCQRPTTESLCSGCHRKTRTRPAHKNKRYKQRRQQIIIVVCTDCKQNIPLLDKKNSLCTRCYNRRYWRMRKWRVRKSSGIPKPVPESTVNRIFTKLSIRLVN